jgi:hypothetical protein
MGTKIETYKLIFTVDKESRLNKDSKEEREDDIASRLMDSCGYPDWLDIKAELISEEDYKEGE